MITLFACLGLAVCILWIIARLSERSFPRTRSGNSRSSSNGDSVFDYSDCDGSDGE